MKLGCTLLLIFFSSAAFASGEVAQTFTFDGRLYNDASATTALEDNVTLNIQVLNPAQDCILYEETQLVDTTTSKGYFTIQVGAATSAVKRGTNDSNHAMSEVFGNVSGTIAGKLISDGTACVYAPTSGEQRYVRVLMTPSDHVTRTLSPNMSLDSVPTAVVAERAETIQGLHAVDLLQVNMSSPEVLSQSHLESIFTSTNFTKLTALLSASPASYMLTSSNGTFTVPTVAGPPASPAAGATWLTGGLMKFFDGTSTNTVLTDLTNINASQIYSGTIQGSTSVNTSGSITTTSFVNSPELRTVSLKVFKAASPNYIEMVAPNTLAAPYTWTLPDALATVNGQVLTSDTTGALNWVSLGTAAALNAGTGATNLVQISVAGKLPALDGFALTNLNVGSVNGTVPVTSGGTGQITLPANRIMLGNGTSAVAAAPAGSAGQILQSAGAASPAWTTATFPSTATQYDLLYASAANTWASLAKVNTGVLVTSNTGAPSWTPGTTANRLLKTNGTTVSFAQADLTTDVTGVLPVANGGSGTSTGDTLALVTGRGATTATASTFSGGLTIGTGLNMSSTTISSLPGGAGIGTVTTGWFSDANNLAARVTGAAGDFYVQSPSGGATYLQSGPGLGKTLIYGNGLTVQSGNSSITSGSLDMGGQTVIDANGGWHRSYGVSGWFNGTYGGGMYMQDTTYVRVYNSKVLYADNYIQSGTAMYSPAFYYTSDARLKENVQTIEDPLGKVLALRGVTFDWIDKKNHDMGFIAQEVEKVLPDMVHERPDEKLGTAKTVKYGNIVALVVEAVKEVWVKVMNHDGRIEKLEKENAELRARLDKIEKSLSRSPATE